MTEIFRLVWLNLAVNKAKVLLTSMGILVGSATIMLVIAIGTGGREAVAEQFKNLSAGAIDITCDYQGNTPESSGKRAAADMPGGMGNTMPQVNMGADMSGGGRMDGFTMQGKERTNTERVTLTQEDALDLETFVPGIGEAAISFSVTADVEGGELESAVSCTIACVKENCAEISNLEMSLGDFLTEENDTGKEKVCVLGYQMARDIFGSVYDAYDGTVYIDNRPYRVSGILSEMGTVASGINPDTAIYIPYNTGLKYLAGTEISPTITVVAEDVSEVDHVMEMLEQVLAESYPNASFTLSDAGSRMEAASRSDDTLTLLLVCMAVIVFIVGGLGIMNVLFVSVKERTNEIGILKAIGCRKKDILLEFLLEAYSISLVGAVLGILLALLLTPILEYFGVRMALSLYGGVLSLVFGVLTGTVFGFYPAYQASNMIPVDALNHE